MKYCKCKGGLIIANLKKAEGECPICKLPKKLNKRLQTMSKMYKMPKVKDLTAEQRKKYKGIKTRKLLEIYKGSLLKILIKKIRKNPGFYFKILFVITAILITLYSIF